MIDEGLLLTKHYGVGAPSQPNYVAAASGDYYGDDNDSFLLVAKNVSTVVDLLEDKGVSWGDYVRISSDIEIFIIWLAC